jgi:predicted acyl esterase
LHRSTARLAALAAAAVTSLAAAPVASAEIKSVFDGRIACTTVESGVRYCEGSTATRVASFDGMPIDLNVAFPPAPAKGADGNYPLLFLLHGWGGSKSGRATLERWANRGYAVLSNSSRGWAGSCGMNTRFEGDCLGLGHHNRLADTRYEVRDVQELAGRLADDGLIDGRRIGTTGGSYGGGQSMALAALRDRIMLPDGTLKPWTSPKRGKAMRIAAAAPEIPWTDLAYSLMPNGRTLDYIADADYGDVVGVMKASFVSGLYATGLASSNYAPPRTDPDADLITWYTLIAGGDPYDQNPVTQDILDEIKSHHSSYYIDHSRPPAPLLIANGWTDDLFPVDEALRFYNRTRTQFPDAEIGLHFIDYGHQRGQGAKAQDVAELRARIDRFLDAYLLDGDDRWKGHGDDDREDLLDVRVRTQTCPSKTEPTKLYTAETWAKMTRGEVRHRSAAAQTVASTGGDPRAGQAFDPITGPGACATAPDQDAPGTAVYRLPAATGDGYTLLGSPTIVADISAPVPSSQIAARLLDVGPDGNETLVARGLYRPSESGRQVFQLHPNAWRFAAGHTPKLELLGHDMPYGRAGNVPFAVTVADLELRLPTRDRANGTTILTPAAKVVPAGEELARDYRAKGSPKKSSKKKAFKKGSKKSGKRRSGGR